VFRITAGCRLATNRNQWNIKKPVESNQNAARFPTRASGKLVRDGLGSSKSSNKVDSALRVQSVDLTVTV